MRSAEEIFAIIDSHPFVKIIPATKRVLSTPDEIRAEADRDRMDERGRIIEKLYSPHFQKVLRDQADAGETVTLETPGKIEIDRDALNELERHIRRELTIYEIEHFDGFLQCGLFFATAEPSATTFLRKVANKEPVEVRWMGEKHGHITRTHEEDSALTTLWKRLIRDAHFSLGAAAVVEMQSAKMRGRTFFTDEGDGPSLYDLTLDEIAKKIPDGLKDRIDRDLAPERAKRIQQSAAIGGDVAAKEKALAEGAEILQNVLAENAELKAKLARNGIS